jgi:branched-chain amino acid transport system ATP-binding protein
VTTLLEVASLHVAYGKVEAVHDVSLLVRAGTIVTVIGPNGAGKTTLLAAIMGLLPARGTVRYLSSLATAWPVEQRVAKGLILVPERRDQLAGTLSGGERQMLAMARALMGKPTLLMLDEPSLGLAPLIVREIFHIISELRATGVAILLVEQNARAALQVADYGYVLETGELALEGSSDELAANPRVAATYLGRSSVE